MKIEGIFKASPFRDIPQGTVFITNNLQGVVWCIKATRDVGNGPEHYAVKLNLHGGPKTAHEQDFGQREYLYAPDAYLRMSSDHAKYAQGILQHSVGTIRIDSASLNLLVSHGDFDVLDFEMRSGALTARREDAARIVLSDWAIEVIEGDTPRALVSFVGGAFTP